jgi:hypothetical protein
MLQTTLAVLDRHESRIVVGAAERAALQDGRSAWRDHYAAEMFETARAHWHEREAIVAIVTGLVQATLWSPGTIMRRLVYLLRGRVRKVLPYAVLRRMERLRGSEHRG